MPVSTGWLGEPRARARAQITLILSRGEVGFRNKSAYRNLEPGDVTNPRALSPLSPTLLATRDSSRIRKIRQAGSAWTLLGFPLIDERSGTGSKLA